MPKKKERRYLVFEETLLVQFEGLSIHAEAAVR